MATSYHVTLPEIEALGCMREEVSLRNVEEPTGRSDSLGDTRVNCGHLYCKYLDKITFTDSTYIIFRCCRFFLYAFHCLSVGSYEVPLLALVLAILTLLPLQRWVVLETRGSDMILHVTARIILLNYHLTL